MKKVVFLIFILQFLITLVQAQITFVITSFPDNTPLSEGFFIAGNFNNWQPGNDDFKFVRRRDGKYSLTLIFPDTVKIPVLEFKITRGSWSSVEGSSSGNVITNRTAPAAPGNILINIEGWEKQDKNHTAQPEVSILDDRFFMSQLQRYRRIWIYLPPDYHSSSQKYPVIYMHDGQNLFDDFHAFAGEWEVDETLNRLFEKNHTAAIVIGIESDDTHRLNEYSPFVNHFSDGEGDLYLNFIIETLKPYVDNHYRTLTEAANTAIIGSSMGGLISFYAALKFPEIFGNAGVFSPSFEYFPQIMDFAANAPSSDSKFFIIAGENESASMAALIHEIYRQLLKNDFDAQNFFIKIDKDGAHKEWYWRREFESAVLWMF